MTGMRKSVYRFVARDLLSRCSEIHTDALETQNKREKKLFCHSLQAKLKSILEEVNYLVHPIEIA